MSYIHDIHDIDKCHIFMIFMILIMKFLFISIKTLPQFDKHYLIQVHEIKRYIMKLLTSTHCQHGMGIAGEGVASASEPVA